MHDDLSIVCQRRRGFQRPFPKAGVAKILPSAFNDQPRPKIHRGDKCRDETARNLDDPCATDSR